MFDVRSVLPPSSLIPHPSSFSSAFTLVEVTLAIAVVAIGLVGILALFPLGLRATRGAMDDTEMATIAQDYISRYQAAAMDTNFYYPAINSDLGVIYNTNYIATYPVGDVPGQSNLFYFVSVAVTNMNWLYNVPFMNVTNTSSPVTSLVSRATIRIWRPGSKTNTFVTEAARYVIMP